jgi:threonine dehydrogenase-like Zn-dependent dehydrogenase
MENVTRTFRRLNANGRVALLARSGQPLSLDAIDYMITNAISLIGSRGHLCGAFSKVINLYQNGRLPLEEIVTNVVAGPEALCGLLEAPEDLRRELQGAGEILIAMASPGRNQHRSVCRRCRGGVQPCCACWTARS